MYCIAVADVRNLKQQVTCHSGARQERRYNIKHGLGIIEIEH
jgi:glutamine synthetase adenylyltransferase